MIIDIDKNINACKLKISIVNQKYEKFLNDAYSKLRIAENNLKLKNDSYYQRFVDYYKNQITRVISCKDTHISVLNEELKRLYNENNEKNIKNYYKGY